MMLLDTLRETGDRSIHVCRIPGARVSCVVVGRHAEYKIWIGIMLISTSFCHTLTLA